MARARAGVSIILDKVGDVMKAMKTVADTQVLAGIPESENARQDDEPIGNAEIGYLMENGMPEINLPARPFLIPGVNAAKRQITDRLRQVGEAALDGKISAVQRGFQAVGLIAQKAIRAKMQSGPFAPLSERTLASRRARGRTGSRPLIDTGQLRNSVTYVVVKNALARRN